MMTFTADENAALKKNCAAILKYLEDEICPNLKTECVFTLPVQAGTRDLKVCIHKNVYMYRADTIKLDEPTNTGLTDYLFGDYRIEERFILVKNWAEMKKRLLAQIAEDQTNSELILNFHV